MCFGQFFDKLLYFKVYKDIYSGVLVIFIFILYLIYIWLILFGLDFSFFFFVFDVLDVTGIFLLFGLRCVDFFFNQKDVIKCKLV